MIYQSPPFVQPLIPPVWPGVSLSVCGHKKLTISTDPGSDDLLCKFFQPTWGNVLCNFQPPGNIWKKADARQVPSSHLNSKIQKKKKNCQRHSSTGYDCWNSTEKLSGNKFSRKLQPTNLAKASNSNFQKLTKVWVWNIAKTLTSKTWPNFRFKISRSFIFIKHGHMDQARKWSIRPGSDERNEIF